MFTFIVSELWQNIVVKFECVQYKEDIHYLQAGYMSEGGEVGKTETLHQTLIYSKHVSAFPYFLALYTRAKLH